MDYLEYKRWIRINDTDVFNIKTININSYGVDYYLFKNGLKLYLSEITAFWHRRGSINIRYPLLPKDSNYKYLSEYLHYENTRVSESVLETLYFNVLGIGNIFDAETNKLSNLSIAFSLGLKVPETLITNTKDELLNFIEKHPSGVITKAMRHGSFLDKKNKLLMKGYTKLVSMEDAFLLPESFAYSFFQERLIKKYAIRTFFLDGNIYSSAIFSQSDDKTKIDFRNYNREKPNRVIPFKLPTEIENKILLLMNKLKFTSGSLDFVYTAKNEFVFLEINPFGQFQQVSLPCNYYLEKKIAKVLIKYSDEHK